jgi:hypothetical protein
MSKLDAAMEKHMNYIVYTEYRPFCYRDFLRFEIDGNEYGMDHGTFRNKISKLMKAGKVELEYISRLAFYTIKGVKFGKGRCKPARIIKTMMTPNHMGVCTCHRCHQCEQQQQHSHMRRDHAGNAATIADAAAIAPTPHPPSIPSISRMIQDLPLDKNSLHDIRLRFEVPDIWTILSASVNVDNSQRQQQQQLLRLNPISKDIALPAWQIKGLNIKVTVHRTDTVSVVVGCSYVPIATDVGGVIRLSNALSKVEERISRLVDDCGRVIPGGYESLPIPEHSIWNVTMWHFGADASIEYTGEKFSISWDLGENVLVRAYSKVMKNDRTRIRLERQEYPRKSFADAIEAKLFLNAGGGEGGSNSY